MKKSILGAALVFGLSTPIFAAGFEDQFVAADALFATRDVGVDGGLANTLAARKAYQAIVDAGAKDGDLNRAVEGVVRTYYYQGEVLLPKGPADKPEDPKNRARKAVWNECWKKALLPLAPRGVNLEDWKKPTDIFADASLPKLDSFVQTDANPVYFYFRASCMAHEAEVSNLIERLAHLPNLLTTFEKGDLMSTEFKAYEGGGFDRVQAAIYGNIQAKPLGIFKPEEAIAKVDASIASTGYSVNPNESQTSGDFFCENYFRKVMVMSVNNQVAAAKALAESTVADFTVYLAEDGIIPESIRVETAHCVSQVAAFAETL